jgi:hypothetical protein
MKFIRPYGQSVTDITPERKIVVNDNWTDDKRDAKILLGLITSTLDKILLKDKKNNKTKEFKYYTQNICNARKNLGDALWLRFQDKLKIDKTTWDRRIRPYRKPNGEDDYGKEDYDPRGKKYNSCVGEDYKWENIISLNNNDPKLTEIIDNIETEINNRLEKTHKSITKTVLTLPDKRKYLFDDNAVDVYFNAVKSDFAETIYQSYVKNKYKLDFKNIMPEIHKNYKDIFNETISKAKEKPHFAVHLKIKEFYKNLIRSKRKKEVSVGDIKNKLSYLIPKDNEALKRILADKNDNRNLNAQIRLGKIIHYTNSCPTNTDAIKASHFWTSTGQTEIKRSEAFIKSWFNFITFASHSLTYLSKKQPKDIMGFQENDFKVELCPQFPDKIKFILGNNHGFDNHYDYLHEIALKKLNRLRNTVFHFHSKENFAQKLTSDIEITDAYFKTTLEKFVQNDLENQYVTLWESLCGVGITKYMHSKEDIQTYWNCITNVTADTEINLNLPKFITVLKRADNTRCKIITPPAVAEDNKGEKQFQYTMLKNLYERPFKAWFENAEMQKLTKWIEATKKRTADATELLNKGDGLSISMDNMPDKFTNLSDYLVALTRLETQRGSVQNGYASDKTAQKKKSNAVENFKMDVIINAFHDFLKAHDMDYLTKGLSGTKEINNFKPNNKTENSFDVWQQELYLLIHFVPVGIACDLEHQMKKYFNVRKHSQLTHEDVKKDEKIINDLYAVFELYRNNNDIKFDGSGTQTPEDIGNLFYANASDYQNIFEQNKSYDAQKAQAQHRHVREMVRFGVSKYLKASPQITHESVEKWQQFDAKDIEQKQKSKAKLHDDWVKNKKLSDSDTGKYKNLVTELSAYNHLDNHVRLVDFRKIHKLTMQVLGRLVGYSFMYERDLYFITLAYLYDNNLTPTTFFECEELANPKVIAPDKIDEHCEICQHKKKGYAKDFKEICNKVFKEYFDDNQIITALNANRKTPSYIKKILKEKETRNYFAHFNMLRDEKLDMTKYINKARDLMAYDRKLKNAVAESIIDIFKKEGMDISFSCENKDNKHELKRQKVDSQIIYHLDNDKDIKENKHSAEYITMVKMII